MTIPSFGDQSEGYFSPGGWGEDPRRVSILDRDLFATRADLKSGADSLFRPNVAGHLHVSILVQGLRTVATHAAAVDAMIPGALGVIHQVTGRLTVREARRSMEEDFSRQPIETGDTFRSIHSRLETTPDRIITDVGPTTFYSPLIELGLARHFAYGPRPFMSIAFSAVLPHHLKALAELAAVAAHPRARLTGPDHGPPTNHFIRRFRAFLYTAEKAVGDIVPYTGIGGLSGPREAAVGLARVLGDLNAVLSRAVGARFTRRLEGKVTGRLIGIGSNTIFASRTIGARISGGERVYNRYAGKYMAKFTSQTKLFGGG